MKKEGVPNFAEDPEKLFRKTWENKALAWQEKIKEAKFSEVLESKLLLLIDKLFIDDYVLTEGRNPKEIEIFLNSCYRAIEEDPSGNDGNKVRIFRMITEDLATIITMDRN